MSKENLDIIFQRRSIRQYSDREISGDLLHMLLEAAMAAPSACGRDPWHFVVVKNPEMLTAIAEGLPNGKMLGEAAIGIVVCGDMERAHGGELSYLIQDCSAAIENLLLAATANGLGGCWLGVHPREERIAHIRSLLSIPESVIPVSVIALGWPRENPSPRTRYRENAVHRERW